MARFCFYPAIEDQSTANDLLARVTWFLGHSAQIEEITFISGGDWSLDTFSAPACMDQSIAGLYNQLRPKLKLSEAESCLTDHTWTAIFLWQDLPEHHTFLKETLGNTRIWKVDKHRTRMEGSFWIEAHLALQEHNDSIRTHATEKLARCRDEFEGLNRSIILTSGPSVGAYKQFDYTNCIPVICNSVVVDKELLETVRPKVICFADPLFHFGPSSYAEAFRAHMLDAYKAYKPWVIVPLKYYQLVLEHLPELGDRLIGLPFSKRKKFNLNLQKYPELKVTANVLTYLLIPFAASFTKDIQLLGCDGRPMSESQYFWSFNARTQLSDELMQNIKEVHPAFFNIDYNDYYAEHLETLENLVHQAESEGRTIYSLAHSHMPILQRRSPPPSKSAFDTLLKQSTHPLFISLNPDLRGNFGHYLHYDKKLRNSLKEYGWDFLTLASRELNLPSGSSDWPVYPYFSLPLFHSNKTRTDNSLYREWSLGFKEEISALVDSLVQCPEREVVVFLYMTSPRALNEVVQILARKPQLKTRWLMNLTGIYVAGWPPEKYLLDERFKLMRFIAKRKSRLQQVFNIELFSDTNPLCKLLSRDGETVPELPMFGVTDLEVEPPTDAKANSPLKVVYPTNVQSLKGFTLLPGAFQKVIDAAPGKFRFFARSHIPIGREHDELEAVLKQMPAEVELHDGVLNAEDYKALLHSADIIALPYRAQGFHLRTSGQLVDAIILGKPVVATGETWAGEIVERYGCGVTFTDGSIEDFASAIIQVADNYTSCLMGLKRAQAEWLSANSEAACANFLHNLSQVKSEQVSDSTRQLLAAELDTRFKVSNKKRHFLDRLLERWLLKLRKNSNSDAAA